MEGVFQIKQFFPSSISFLPNLTFILLSFIFGFLNILGKHNLQKEVWQNQLRSEAATGGVTHEKMFLKISQNSQENICVRVSFLMKLLALACKFIEKYTLVQMFSCEFCETKHLFYRIPLGNCFCTLFQHAQIQHFPRKKLLKS